MEKRKGLLLCIITGLFWFSLYAYVPYLPSYLNAMGATATIIGYVTSSYGLSQLILRIPIGILADLLKRQKIFVMAGVLLAGIAGLGIRLFPYPLAVLGFRGLSGVAASMWSAFTVLYSSYFPADQHTKAIGRLNSFNHLGKFLSSVLGGMVAQAFGISAPFLLSFFAGLLGFILACWIIDTTPQRTPLKVRELISVAKNPSLLTASILAVLSQMVVCATSTSFMNTVAEGIGAQHGELGIMQAVYSVTMIFASLLVGSALSKKMGDRAVVAIGFSATLLSCLLAPFCPNMLWIYLTQVFGGIGNGILFSQLLAMAVRKISPEKKSSATGCYQAIYGLGMTVGPAMMGIFVDHLGMTTAFLIMAGITLVALIISLIAYNKKRGLV